MENDVKKMDIDFTLDVKGDDRLLNEEDQEHVIYSSDEDGSDCSIPDPCIELDPYPEFLDETKPKVMTKSEKEKLIDEYMKKSLIKPGFEALHSVPCPKSDRAERLKRKKERENTKGPGWFNLPVQEMTEEVKNDIELLKMRSVLDPKHFYKNNDITHTPKYFQIGTVVENAADFYSGRIPKAQRKRTLVDELLADAESRAHQKKKFKTYMDTNVQKRRKAHAHSNKLKKKK